MGALSAAPTGIGGIVAVLPYIQVAVATVGGVPPEINRQRKDYALAAAAKPSLSRAGFTLVSVSGLLVHTANDNPPALAIFAGLLGVAYAFEWLYPRLSGRPQRKASKDG